MARKFIRKLFNFFYPPPRHVRSSRQTRKLIFFICNLILTQLDEIWKNTWMFSKIEYELKYFVNGRRPHFFFNGRQSRYSFKWQKTSKKQCNLKQPNKINGCGPALCNLVHRKMDHFICFTYLYICKIILWKPTYLSLSEIKQNTTEMRTVGVWWWGLQDYNDVDQ